MAATIDIECVLRDIPHSDGFPSVKSLHELVDGLRTDRRFDVSVAGTSAAGVPIHHVKFGSGSLKTLLVGGVHAMEPIGALTVRALINLLRSGHHALLEPDIEWHIVPCIDPDGALLNEGWTQQPFTLENFVKNYYMQAYQEQVDMSFPISYKRLRWSRPSQEAGILQGLIDEVLPDFYFPLHNARVGGAFYLLSHDIGERHYEKIYDLLRKVDFPLQTRPIWRELYVPFARGVLPMHSIKQYYDYLERTTECPEARIPWGAGSSEYLGEIKPAAQSFIAELGYVQHPCDQSEEGTGKNLRQFKLRIEAESKFLASVILQEWERTRNELDSESPFWRAIAGGTVFLSAEKLPEGGYPLSRYSTRDNLFNPDNDREMTEGDLFDACFVDGGFMFLHQSYQFVRLLKVSRQSQSVRRAIERLETAFEEAMASIGRYVDFAAFRPFSSDAMAKVQLGSGLIVLNSLCEGRRGKA